MRDGWWALNRWINAMYKQHTFSASILEAYWRRSHAPGSGSQRPKPQEAVVQCNAQTPSLHFPSFVMCHGWWALNRLIVLLSAHLYSTLSFHFLRSWGYKFSSRPSSFMHGFLVTWDLNSKNEKYPFPAFNLTMRFFQHFKVMHLTSLLPFNVHAEGKSWTLERGVSSTDSAR